MESYLHVWAWILSGVSVVLGGAIGLLYDYAKGINRHEKEIAKEIADFKNWVASEYVTIREMERKGDKIQKNFDELTQRVNVLYNGRRNT